MTEATAPSARTQVLVSAALFVFTLAWRGAQLGRPSTFVFDETFYANDALDLVTHGAEKTYVGHPPLGKWLIGLPMFSGHFSPVTWRLSALVAGAVVVVLAFLLAVRLTSSLGAGLLTSAFVLTDGVAHFVGRYALLDGFATMFTTATVLVLVVTAHRRQTSGRAVLVGALAGAALVTKWSALPIVVIAVGVVVVRAARADGRERGIVVGAVTIAAAIVVYVGSFTPWIVNGSPYGNCTVPACSSNPVSRLVRLPAMQTTMLRSNASIGRESPLRTDTWRWVSQDEPMTVAVPECTTDSQLACRPKTRVIRWIDVRGSRILWLLSVPVVIAAVVRRRRAHRWLPEGIAVTLGSALALWLPWLTQSKTFVYYAAPVVPLLAASTAAVAYTILPRRAANVVAVVFVVVSVPLFLLGRGGAPWAA